MTGPLVLASRSPQRRALLEQVGVDFEVRVPDVEEATTGNPVELAVENARRKARAVEAAPEEVVIGVDTIVVLDGAIHGKPPDEAAARAVLAALNGRTHEVVSGVCLRWRGQDTTAAATTRVTFRELEPVELQWYVKTEEWRDRAGGYAIQGAGLGLVKSIEGDYSNVVGLPVPTLLELLLDLSRPGS